jgi:hypothetical protein
LRKTGSENPKYFFGRSNLNSLILSRTSSEENKRLARFVDAFSRKIFCFSRITKKNNKERRCWKKNKRRGKCLQNQEKIWSIWKPIRAKMVKAHAGKSKNKEKTKRPRQKKRNEKKNRSNNKKGSTIIYN